MPDQPTPRASLRSFLLLLLLARRTTPELQLLGRTLLHAALVGLAAGGIGTVFFASLELVQRVLLEGIAGYAPLRASGEQIVQGSAVHGFQPWMLLFLPALGGLVAGLLMCLAPEARGGGGDDLINALHHRDGFIRKRVIWVKGLASIATLGTGGAGGREGPTMQIGGAIGSWIADRLRATAEERRILVVAGVAAGMSAVFRTPLGAALLAIEVLYRDDFETEALVPAVLASVVSYALATTVFGETTLFAHAASYPFIPAHLPLYGVLALVLVPCAMGFVKALHSVQRYSALLPGPVWIRPAIGGLALGLFAVPAILWVGQRVGVPGQGLGILGGGYGAAQMSIMGSELLPSGWTAVELLLLLAVGKVIASSLTIGSGGSAGDFAPSIALGGILGGAFGLAAKLVLHDPRLDPGAFALVGMGTFYGGIAHVPLSSLILVCELAGSYDLLVPLMLAEGLAFVALRNCSLYRAQLKTRRTAPTERVEPIVDLLDGIRVADLVRSDTRPSFGPHTPCVDILACAPQSTEHRVFPVFDEEGRLCGLVDFATLQLLSSNRQLGPMAIADDVMKRPVFVDPDSTVRAAAETMVINGLHEIPVKGPNGMVLGFLSETDVFRAYLDHSSPDLPASPKRPRALEPD